MARWLRCSCPVCRHPTSRVVATNEMADGTLVRERRCSACDYRWFTAQEPEYVLPRAQVVYSGKKPALLQQ